MKIKWNEYTWYSKLVAAIFFILLLPAWTFYLGQKYGEVKELTKQTSLNTQYIDSSANKQFDAMNATFTVENAPVTLVKGVSQVHPASIPSATITTRYFGNEARGDLNGDGLEDVAFLITQDGGGSGLFYYAVVALKTTDGYTTTNAFLVGDRIAPQSTRIPPNSQELQVNYADRRTGEPMTAQPTQGKTLLLKVTSQGVLEGLMK